MINSNSVGHAGPTDDFALLSLQVLWCSDCHADQLFERPPAEAGAQAQPGGVGAARLLVAGEWACTGCGAAYFDGIDTVFEIHEEGRIVTNVG